MQTRREETLGINNQLTEFLGFEEYIYNFLFILFQRIWLC